MAFTMKHWLSTVFLGFAVIAIWTLPPGGSPNRDSQVVSGEQIRANRLASEFRTAGGAYRRLAWSDSLVPLVTAPSMPDVSVLYPAEADLPEAQKLRYLERVQSEVRALEPSGGVRFALALIDPSVGRLPGMAGETYDRTELYAGVEDSQEYCIQVRPVRSRSLVPTVSRELARTDRVPPVSNSLGLCAMYLRHGMPGPNVEAWISAGGAILGLERGTDDRPELRIRPRSLLGIRWSDRPFHVDRCFTGHAASCGEAFEDPVASNRMVNRNVDIVAQSPVLWIGYPYHYPGLASDDAYILADLEEDFGRDAFTAFWTSEADMPMAFAEAFGVSHGEWLQSWVSQRYEVDARGPGLNRAATSGSFLTILLMLLFAFSNQRKRTVIP